MECTHGNVSFGRLSGSSAYSVLDTNILENALWQFVLHLVRTLGILVAMKMAKPHCFMGYCHNRIVREMIIKLL